MHYDNLLLYEHTSVPRISQKTAASKCSKLPRCKCVTPHSIMFEVYMLGSTADQTVEFVLITLVILHTTVVRFLYACQKYSFESLNYLNLKYH